MGRRSRSRSASHSPSRSSRRAAASSSSRNSSRRYEDAPSSIARSSRHRSRSRSPHRRHASGGSRRRSSSDLDANDAHKKRQRTERDDAESKRERFGNDDAPDGDAKGAVKANTVEKNGEISMSIEETNRVRAALGLKPLSLGPKKKDENVVNLQKTSDQVDEERERAELQKKLAQSKRKRELTQKLAGQSIGEQLKASASTSALDWVKQSRSKVDDAAAEAKKSKQKTAKQAAAESEEYSASALAGMVVGHDIKSFEEGDEVVLTLKDSRVLAQDGNELNDEQDELMNVELSERDRRHAEKQRAQRAMMPAYTGFDDDEFIQMGGSSGRMKKPARLLSQYDDEDDRKATQQAQRFTLDASGGTTVVASDATNAADDLDNEGAVVSLAMDKTKSIDEYYTQEEIDAQFSKKKGKKLRKKKKVRQQQISEEEEAGGETGESAASLVQQLEAEALKNASKDRGRRRRRVEEDDNDAFDSKQSGIEEENLLRFQEARERANATASSALQAMTGTKKKRRPVALDDDDVFDDAMDMELSASLAQTRRLAQLKEKTHVAAESSSGTVVTPSVVTSEDRIAALVSQTIGAESAITDVTSSLAASSSSSTNNTKPQAVGHVFGATLQDLETSSKTVVFNEATDFETRLKNAMEQRNAQFQAATVEAATQVGRQAESAAAASTQSTANRHANDGDEEMKGQDEGDNEDDDEEEETKDGEVWGEEQPLVGSGMAATLALLRKTGDLRETRVERQAGRANDARDRNVDEELKVKDGVKLDYRDEFGRLLTKKEAFRLLSYKFHGHEPGKKKKEKRLKQLKEELEAQKMLSGEGSTKMMKVLEKKQKISKQAHVVLGN